MRTNDNPSMFVPANDPSSDQFFWIDVPALAKACDMPEGTPLIEVYEALHLMSFTSPLRKGHRHRQMSTQKCGSHMQDNLSYMLQLHPLSSAAVALGGAFMARGCKDGHCSLL